MVKQTNKILTLDRGNYTTATIHIHGGTLLSWRVEEKEVLYLKSKTSLDGMSPIRGGSKFAFPYYGHSQSGPEHGFARYVPWKVNYIDDVEIENVSTSRYTDWNTKVHYEPGEQLALNEKGNFKIDRAVRTIFLDVPGDITIKNVRPGIHLRFSSSIKDFMVHNAWTTTMVNQHEAGEHFKYLGCGYGCIGKARRLLPGETWEYYRYIECIDEEYDSRKEELVNKLSNLNDIVATYCGQVNTNEF